MSIVDCAALWPENAIARELLWPHIAGKLGFSAPLQRPVLICVRGAAPGEAQSHEMVARPRYDDTFALLPVGKPPTVFAGASHSYQVDSAISPDVNHDGRPDVGSIRPGRYVLTDSKSEPYPIFYVRNQDGTDRIACFRDTDHDGKISEAEEAAAIAARGGPQEDDRGMYSTAVLVHSGWDAPPDSPHRSSISCLTMNVKHLAELREAARPYGGIVDCPLIEVSEVVELIADFDPGTGPLATA